MLSLSHLAKGPKLGDLALEPSESVIKGFVFSSNDSCHTPFPPFFATRIYPGGQRKLRPANR